ncbi:MAG: sensor histidine kinase [Myxococcota bacterium]
MGVFSGFVAALAILPVALVLVVWDTNAGLSLAGEKAITTAELRAGSDTLELPNSFFDRLDVAFMVSIQGEEQVVERGEDLSIPMEASAFGNLCDRPGTYEFISLGGRRWAWSCATTPRGHILTAVAPHTVSVAFVGFLLFILVAVVGLVTALVVLRVLSPLTKVSQALNRVSSGERGVTLQPTGLAELDDIIFQINDTAAAMGQREDAITAQIRVAQRMAKMVAHEVRNPLQSVELLTSLMVSENSLSERRQTAEAIRKEIQDLDQVVSRLLKRSVGADLEINPRPTKAETLVQHLVQMHRASAHDGGVNLEVTGVCDRDILVDSALIGRSLENLLVNALHYAESRVRIQAIDVEGAVAFHVDDDGPGVASNIATQVFAANVSGREGGHGLGLALVRAVAEAHGGTATHTTSPLGGSRFILTVPTAPPQDALP